MFRSASGRLARGPTIVTLGPLLPRRRQLRRCRRRAGGSRASSPREHGARASRCGSTTLASARPRWRRVSTIAQPRPAGGGRAACDALTRGTDARSRCPTSSSKASAAACPRPTSTAMAAAPRAAGLDQPRVPVRRAVDRVASHGLPSPHPRLPLTRHFCFPGFTRAHRRPAARARPRSEARRVARPTCGARVDVALARRRHRRRAGAARCRSSAIPIPRCRRCSTPGRKATRPSSASCRRASRRAALDAWTRRRGPACRRRRSSRGRADARGHSVRRPGRLRPAAVGAATSTSCAARIRSCARNGRRGRSSGTSIRRPTTRIASSWTRSSTAIRGRASTRPPRRPRRSGTRGTAATARRPRRRGPRFARTLPGAPRRTARAWAARLDALPDLAAELVGVLPKSAIIVGFPGDAPDPITGRATPITAAPRADQRRNTS